MRHANFCIIENDSLKENPLVIKDIGPWSRHTTVTNDVEYVIDKLIRFDYLPQGRKLFYIDSDGNKDEILINENGKFASFKKWVPK